LTRIALIGAGHWGRNHLKALRKLREEGYFSELIVCDNNKDVLDSIKDFNDIETEENWKNLLSDSKLDLVIIATPSNTHYLLSKEFMLSGKDVLVEKPLALNSNECDELLKIRDKTNTGLMVGHIFRFHPIAIELKQKIARGDFGEILNIKIFRQTIAKPRKDIGVMLALGIHDVDLCSFLLGDKLPDSIYADINSFFGQTEESALIIQKFGKTTCYSFESWIDPTKGKLRELYLVGSKGSASFDFSEPDRLVLTNSYLTMKKEENKEYLNVIADGNFTIVLEYKEPLRQELIHFIEESSRKKEYIASAEIGKRAVQMIETAIESNKQKKSLEIHEL